ncbi:hypothetical protein KQX54_010668 [Cotesia glomerata]|uniref:Uncharacterized protein n=1 Tax=Cotesia glomerata TaxID=32391 RepID=A0AAV7IK77_COTGL|nr:hypothetical protein KQX54_010668 [Cotesia glomerata]
MELRRSCSKKRLRIIKRLSLASPIATAEKKDKKKPDKNTAKKTKRRPINDNQENITSLRKHLSDQNILKRYQSRKDKITTFNHMAIQDRNLFYCINQNVLEELLMIRTNVLPKINHFRSLRFFKTLPGVRPLQEINSIDSLKRKNLDNKRATSTPKSRNDIIYEFSDTSDHSGATDDDSIPSESQSPSPSRRSLQENLERSSSVSRISEPGQNNEFHHQFSFETRKRQRYLSHRRLPREEHSPRRSPKRRRSTSREPLFEGEPSPRRSSERRRSESRELLSEGEPSLQRSPKRRRSTSREPLLEGEPSPRRSLERRRSTSREPLLEGEPSPRRSSERRRSTSRKPLFEGEPSPRRSLERRRPPPRELLSEGKPSPRRSLERRRPPPREPLSEGRLSPRRSLERRRPPPREPLSEGEASLRRSPKRRRPPPHNELDFNKEDGDVNEDVHIMRKDLRSDLKSFRRVILLDMKKYSKNILKKRHNRSTGMVEFFEGVFLEQKWLLKAATARKMSLRANHVMRAYWSRSKRMNLYAKNPKGLRNAIEVQSKEYQDLIDIFNALPKINSVRRNKKQKPDINKYKWVRTFLKNDRFQQRHGKKTRPRKNTIKRAQSV